MKTDASYDPACHPGCPKALRGHWSRWRGAPLQHVMSLALALLAALGSQAPAQVDDDDRVVLIPWVKAPKEAPVFHSVDARVRATVRPGRIEGVHQLDFQIHQGQAKVLSIEWFGQGDVVDAVGKQLGGWSLRTTADDRRFLDIHLKADADGALPRAMRVLVTTRSEWRGEQVDVMLPGPAAATGYALRVTLNPESGADVRAVKARHLLPVKGKALEYVAQGAAQLRLKVTPAGARINGIEVMTCGLTGRLADDGRSMQCTLLGTIQSEGPGSTFDLLTGQVAMDGKVSGAGWQVALRRKADGGWAYELRADRAGSIDIELPFHVPVGRTGDWSEVDFTVPGGVVVPMHVDGFSGQVDFMDSRPVVPKPVGREWVGFLPASGRASMAWRARDQVADGSLFFSSKEITDVRVGSGLVRQTSRVDLRVLQGKLQDLGFLLEGDAEVLSVDGDSVIAWNVREVDGKRRLEVTLSRPIDKADRITVESQVALTGDPLRAAAIRLSPVGVLRHSGWLRVANEGSVRVELVDAQGLIQLAPHQFPGAQDPSLRQVMVYRFPSAGYEYQVHATQVLPEVGVTEVTVYELGESDQRIHADIELDIHEAPLREWEMRIPADHAVSSVAGAQVADYAVGSEVRDGMRRLKILFKGAVMDRQLVRVVMAKNQSPKAGEWRLQPLDFPGVKSHRGYLGAVATAGYRLNAGKLSGVSEIPVTFFPKRFDGLQQAFRLRDSGWSVVLGVEALGQSVQADVFHLYSLKSGAVYGSVLMNFFVVGAPANEWRVSVPEGIGNIDVTGQQVGRDWRRSGDTVIIPLSSPVLGAGTVLLTFEQPMNSRGGRLLPGAVRPLGVQGERGFVQVVSPLQVNHRSTSSGSVLGIDPSEIPTEFRLLSTAPTLGAWQYTAREFEIGMEVEWFAPGETIDQVVDYQELSSRVSRDGQWVTDARIFVKTRGHSVLRMRLPEGVVLWEAMVNGLAVNAREDGADTLVPLSSGMDPNKAVEVSLRYGAEADSARRMTLQAPVFEVPTVMGAWRVSGDDGRQLVPKGGSASLVRPVLAETGWQWLARNRWAPVLLLVLGALAIGLVRANEVPIRLAGLLGGLLFMVAAGVLATVSLVTTRDGSEVLEYASPVVAAGQGLSVEVANLPQWQARTDSAVWIGFVLGLAVVIRGVWVADRWWFGCGLAMIVASFLSIHGGAALFFAVIGGVVLFWWIPQLIETLRGWKKPPAATAAIGMALIVCLHPGPTHAADVPVDADGDPLPAAESMVQSWEIRGQRMFGTLKVVVNGRVGDRYLLLKPPAVLSRVEGSGARVEKGPYGSGQAYWLETMRSGRVPVTLAFEMPLVDPAKGWELPAGPAAVQHVAVDWDQPGWRFVSSAAARVARLPGLKDGHSGAWMALSPGDAIRIHAQAKQRDAASEATRFFAEASNLYVPGPGVVNGSHRVTIRPAQGQVGSLTMKVPDGFTVSDVTNGPVGHWRFDPDARELRVHVEPVQIDEFSFTIDTQRSVSDLPMNLRLQPMRVTGCAGEVGLLGLAFGDEVQPEGIETEGLSMVNPEDFGDALLPRDRRGGPLAVLLHAFRYGGDEAGLRLRVNPVAPELRAHATQLVSLGEDRLVVTNDLEVSITRAGVFRLTLDVPESLEVESATGDGLSHWTQARVDGRRVVILHLTGKTIGIRKFSLTLVGRATGEQQAWSVPKVQLLGASRETGVLTIVPDRGLRIRAVKRKNVTQLDPRELVGGNQQVARASVKAEALSYRMLQGDWELDLSIRRLDPWVTAQILHETTIREGQVLTKLQLSYRIDNAAVKSQRIRIPGLDAQASATVRATGAAVADLIAVEGEPGLWEIRFQRGIAGNCDVAVEYQRPSAEGGREEIAPVELVGVRQTTYVLTLRAGGRLELSAGAVPRGWGRSDWSAVQATLKQRSSGEPPSMTFRVADVDGPLPVTIKRHDLADLRKIRVTEGSLTTLISPDGGLLTAASMRMKVVDKSTMRLRLPEGAELFNVFVNDEGAPLVREGRDWLFYVFPSPDAARPTEVRFVYGTQARKGDLLEGPVLDVPMENLTWKVLVPEGWRLTSFGGDFDLKRQEQLGAFRLEDYRSFVTRKMRQDSKQVVHQLDQAQAWLKAGDQRKASLALSNVLNNGQLDAASSEDARVQLRRLKTQQAVLGLNSRRQKVLLDNRNAAPQQELNPQLNRAAEINSVLQGRYNYDPEQFDRFLEGNTADENAALKEIANRIVAQQLAAEPAPTAIDITLPDRGTVISFGRSVQVGSDEPMTMKIEIERAGGGVSLMAVLLCLMVGAIGVLRRRN